jgi:hypothetical protein
MVMTEFELQKSIFDWVGWSKAKIPELGNFFAIPNGGSRHPAEAARLKQTGVLAGVFDTFLAVPTKNSHGMFLELKVGKNKLSEAQKTFQSKMTCYGYRAYVAYTFDEAIYLINKQIEENQGV